MIQVILRGGLGNQMFEYALGLALAKKYKTDLVLDATYLNDRFPRRKIIFRAYDLDVFGVEPQFTPLSKISAAVPVPGVWLGFDLGFAVARNMLGIRTLAKEKDEARFDSAILESGKDACLWGFWQSEKYFAGAEEEVRQAFRFPEGQRPEAVNSMAERIRATNSISLSVRRSDYTKGANAKLFGETDMKYYNDAIHAMVSRVPSPHFFVFSDDIPWCRDHVKPPFPTTYVPDELRGPKWRYAMELSSLCKHQIIANSTFWWWAAWLNQNPGKIVIAPKRWYVHSATDVQDVVPDGWIGF